MALPFLAAAIATYPVFLVMFRGQDYIPDSIDVQGEESAIEPSSVLADRWGAIFGSVLLTVTLGVLVGTSILDVPVWQITVPPAVIMFVRDVIYDWYTARPSPQLESIDCHIADGRSSPTTERGWILEAAHPKLSDFKIPHCNDCVEAASHCTCTFYSVDVRSGTGSDE